MAAGCNVNQRGFDGKTPLHCAAERLQSTNIEALLAHGADVTLREESTNMTPLDHLLEFDVLDRPHLKKSVNSCAEVLFAVGNASKYIGQSQASSSKNT